MLPEGRFDLVAPPGARFAVVVLHPHPDMGGDRFHPVVDAVHHAAAAEGWASVRFDFSSSAVDIAATEALGALDLLPVGVSVAVIGYSFGAAIAAHLPDDRITSWVLVAPPFGSHVAAAGLPAGAVPRPKLVLAGEHDQWCSPGQARDETEAWELTYVETVAGADHFLAGAEAEVARRALDFVRP